MDDSQVIAYKYNNQYLNFIEWKKQCYIQPAYDLIKKTKEFEFMNHLYHDLHISLGLVHPKGLNHNDEIIPVITKEYIRELYDSDQMCCMPYCIAGLLLGVEIYNN